MTIKNIKKLLEDALIRDGVMDYGLYEYELEELLGYLKSSLTKDGDEFIFAVTENSGHVAMVPIERSGKLYINESARDKLKYLWRSSYLRNMKKLIPAFAIQLKNGTMPITGVKTLGALNA